MLKLELTLVSENASAATKADARNEAMHQLRRVANIIEAGECYLRGFPLQDANGNTIGDLSLELLDSEDA